MKIKVTFESTCDNCGKTKTLSWNYGERNPKDTDPYITTTYLDMWGEGLPDDWELISFENEENENEIDQELFCSSECLYAKHPELKDAEWRA
jgi:hypothetical protein